MNVKEIMIAIQTLCVRTRKGHIHANAQMDSMEMEKVVLVSFLFIKFLQFQLNQGLVKH